jgi:hypothetical protein
MSYRGARARARANCQSGRELVIEIPYLGALARPQIPRANTFLTHPPRQTQFASPREIFGARLSCGFGESLFFLPRASLRPCVSMCLFTWLGPTHARVMPEWASTRGRGLGDGGGQGGGNRSTETNSFSFVSLKSGSLEKTQRRSREFMLNAFFADSGDVVSLLRLFRGRDKVEDSARPAQATADIH